MKIQVCLIASNSQESIESCIESWSFCDRFFVYLNNSTDNTEKILIRTDTEYVKGPFLNFSQARNDCLRLSYDPKYTYTICIDDSYEFVGDSEAFCDELFSLTNHQLINMKIKTGNFLYISKRILKTDSKIRYVHEIHEELAGDAHYTMRSGYINDVIYSTHIIRTKIRENNDLLLLKGKDARSLYYKACLMFKLKQKGIVDVLNERIALNDTDYEERMICYQMLGYLSRDPKYYVKAALEWPDRASECYFFAYLISENRGYLLLADRHNKVPECSRLAVNEDIYKKHIKDCM